MKHLLPILLLALVQTVHAQTVKLAWDEVVGYGVTNYTLYATTNASLSTTNYSTKIDVGRSLEATITGISVGTKWLFGVTCKAYGIESPMSSTVTVQFPPAPINVRMLTLQYSADMTNWIDLGVFRLKIQ